MKTLYEVGNALELLDARQRANHKGQELAKLNKLPRTQRAEVDIEVKDIKAVEGGVEYYARAWNKDGEQIGFGKDGSVEWERFRVINPPILIPDGTKKEIEIDFGPNYQRDNYIEDLEEALLSSLEHTIKVKKEKFGPEKIIAGKIGHTTLTAYPAAGQTSPVDGELKVTNDNTAWNTLVATAEATSVAPTAADGFAYSFQAGSSSDWQIITRSIFLFDTSSIGGDNISSAIMSLKSPAKLDGNSATPSVNVYSSAPAANDDVVVGDFDSCGTTAFATAVAYADQLTDGNYTDFTFVQAGKDAIDKSGISKFSSRSVNDATPTEPNRSGNSANNYFYTNYADQTGTTSDPKLVVEHSSAAGPAGIKTYNDIASASVKTINDIAIASVKTWNDIA